MTDYKIHPVRFAGRIQSYVTVINGKTFVQGKDAVFITDGNGVKRTVKNSFYPDFKSEKEIDEWLESLCAPIIYDV